MQCMHEALLCKPSYWPLERSKADRKGLRAPGSTMNRFEDDPCVATQKVQRHEEPIPSGMSVVASFNTVYSTQSAPPTSVYDLMTLANVAAEGCSSRKEGRGGEAPECISMLISARISGKRRRSVSRAKVCGKAGPSSAHLRRLQTSASLPRRPSQ